MIPQFGQFLVDARTGESRFRLQRYFRQGRSFDLLLAQDTHHDDALVVVKAIRYDDDRDPSRIAETNPSPTRSRYWSTGSWTPNR
jgi:hypothetical protein